MINNPVLICSMNKYIFFLLFLLAGYKLQAQCLVSSLPINTGYNSLTASSVTPGTDGGTPVPDPHWTVTAESPSIATAIFSTGLIEVVPGSAADVIPTLGGWTGDPVGVPGGWLSCINSNTYSTDGTGPSGTPYNMTFGRPFRMCADDNITLDLYIANDNYISAMDIDGTLLTFSQPAGAVSSYFTSFTHFTQTVFLAAGTHTMHVVVNNYNDVSPESNPTGLNIYGTVASSTGVNTIVSESSVACDAYVCSGTCDAISLPDTLHACSRGNVVLPAILTGTNIVDSIGWSPTAGLSSSAVLTPTLTVGGTSRMYNIVVVSTIPNNLVANGDFSGGNIDFSSGYTYEGTGTTSTPGYYAINTNPFIYDAAWPVMGDHTTGTGNMLIVDGAYSATESFWCETMGVLPNTDYIFSVWVALLHDPLPSIQLKINGIVVGTFAPSATAGAWIQYTLKWNSGLATTANICMYDLNTGGFGNDFAIDDISFQQLCTLKDSVYVAVTPTDTTASRRDTTLCLTSAPITLTGTPGYTSYLWNTSASSPSISVGANGTYWVYNENLCVAKIDTFGVTFIPLPVVSIGNDTAFCIGNTITLYSAQPTGSAYLWSDGTTGDSIHVSTSGTYWLQVYNGTNSTNGCTVTDSIHVLVSPFPIVDLGPDQFNCLGNAVTLSSSVSYIAPAYLWSDFSTAPSLTVATTGAYWLQVTVAGCAAADSINVTIIYDTFTLHNVDTAICKGNAVQAYLTINPSATVQWLPTAGISASTTPSPLIIPDTSAEYTANISIDGCPVKTASFFIDVQPNPQVYIGNNRSVCANDTLHLLASVTPAWYTHYAYHWSPAAYFDDSTYPYAVYTPGTDTTIILTVTTPDNCKGVDSIKVAVHPADFAHLDSVFNVCPGDSVQLQPTGGVAYHWSPGIYLSDSLSAAPWLKAITSQYYTLIATSAFGCLDTLSAHITVRPNAVIFLDNGPITLYPGQSYQITPQSNCTYFSWFPTAGLSDANISNPLATPGISTKYIVHGSNEWGCTAIDSLDINIDGSSALSLPNAFTPGGEVNGTLYLLNRGISSLHYFRVFNRWGNKVFETSDLSKGWDGNYKGTPQPYDVYVYEIEAVGNDGTTFHKQGNVTLIR